MSEEETIICRPTRWFTIRAVVMLLMFGVFAVLFYKDGSTGYRNKNEVYFLQKAFEEANREFSEQSKQGGLTPEAWHQYAAGQEVKLPADHSLLPADMQIPQPWPPILHDYERMKPLQWNILWREYTRERGMSNKSVEEPYDARKIKDQWVVFWIALALTLVTAFFLLRTLRRTISADHEAVTDQRGFRIPYTDLRTLDLRKWETKGLAFINFDGPSGKGRLRIDGLTYGGFKAEDNQPAERLMQAIKQRFSGEIIEFAPVPAETAKPSAGNSTAKSP